MKNLLLSFLGIVVSTLILRAQPTVTAFNPVNATPGMTMTITGTGFTGASSVTIGGATASFVVNSSTSITATVPVTQSGTVVVTTGAGSGSRAGFYYVPTSEIITDFGGFWRARAIAPATILPDNSHNLLAFSHDGVMYSTGVNNAILTNNSVSFTPGNFKALPVAAIVGTATGTGSVYIALGAKVDGSPTAYVAGASSFTVRNALIDGQNGLNLGTGVTNLPPTAVMTFLIYNIDATKTSDAEPDIVITQIADPSPSNDVFEFLDASGNLVGNAYTQDMQKLPQLGTYTLDLFSLSPGVPYNSARPYGIGSNGSNTTRPIRLVSLRLSDFGINASNSNTVRALRITPSGNSDYAFIGYNANSINLPPNAALSPETSLSRICPGGAASLEIIGTPAAGGALSYVWEESVNGGTTWTPISDGGNFSGSTTARLMVANAVAGREYRATVFEEGNGNAGISGKFTITAATGTPPTTVSATLTSSNICANTPVQVRGAVTGGTDLTYQWQVDSSGVYENIAGANTLIYVPERTNTGVKNYRLFSSAGAGCPGVFSAPVRLTVTGISSATPAARCGPGTVTLTAATTSGNVSWFSGPTDPTPLFTGNNFTTPVLTNTTTYFVASEGCAERLPVIATINNASAAGSISTMAGTEPNTTVLTLTSQVGNIVKWQSSTDNFTLNIVDIANTQAQIVVERTPTPTVYRAVVESGNCGEVYSLVSQTILPVKANSLVLSKAGGAILLQWETYDQQQVLAYEIERSKDGTQFEKIGSVNPNSSEKYQWRDENPLAGPNYYRIREVSVNGQIHFSRTAFINQEINGLKVFPNPVQGNAISVQMGNAERGDYRINIRTNNGQLIYSELIRHNGGNLIKTINLPVKPARGYYGLELTGPAGTRHNASIIVN